MDVLTQSWVRPRIVKDTAEAEKHIICEKPFARSMEEAGVKIAVHQPTRWYYPFALAKILVEEGYIGEPFFLTTDVITWIRPITKGRSPGGISTWTISYP